MKDYIKTALFIFAFVVAASVHGQVTVPSSEQLAAIKREKTDSLTKVDFQQVLDMLAIKLPVLPALADDPNRPANVTQRKMAVVMIS